MVSVLKRVVSGVFTSVVGKTDNFERNSTKGIRAPNVAANMQTKTCNFNNYY